MLSSLKAAQKKKLIPNLENNNPYCCNRFACGVCIKSNFFVFISKKNVQVSSFSEVMLNTYFQGEATINQIRQLLLLSHRGCWNKSLWWVFSLADHTKASFFRAESEELLEKRKVNTKSTSSCFFFFIKTVFNIFRILFNW